MYIGALNIWNGFEYMAMLESHWLLKDAITLKDDITVYFLINRRRILLKKLKKRALPLYIGCIQSRTQKKSSKIQFIKESPNNLMYLKNWHHVPTYIRIVDRNFSWVTDTSCSLNVHVFLSLQIHHIRHIEMIFQISKLDFLPNGPFLLAKTSRTVLGIMQHTLNKHEIRDHSSLSTSQWRKWWSTNSPSDCTYNINP